jgi:hypothetical protein
MNASTQVRRLLDLSIAHLPQEMGDPNGACPLHTVDGVTAYQMRHGWLMWVPDDPDERSREYEADPVPEAVLAVQRAARALDCDWVMFDQDADTIDGLPVWEW